HEGQHRLEQNHRRDDDDQRPGIEALRHLVADRARDAPIERAALVSGKGRGGGEGVHLFWPNYAIFCYEFVGWKPFHVPTRLPASTQILLPFVGGFVHKVCRSLCTRREAPRSRQDNKLTALKVKALEKPGRYGDGLGLWLQVRENRGNTWGVRYMLHSNAVHMGLGATHTVSLQEAREKAREARKLGRVLINAQPKC